ncbi:MAG: alanine dehydrogenase [Leptospirales bacterium]
MVIIELCMVIGVLKELKVEENRVAMTPAGVEVLTGFGHEVWIVSDAGKGSGFSNEDYTTHGARLKKDRKELFQTCDLLLHVKEPQSSEYALLRKDQIIFTYLHLAASEALTEALVHSKAVCIGYETIQKDNGTLPLLTPMSEIGGRMAIQQGAKFLEMEWGGRGVLLGGVPGVETAAVVVLGGGAVGINAAKMAAGLGARVYIVDKNLQRLRYLDDVMPANCFTMFSNPANIRSLIREADVVVGGVLIPGARAPKLITRKMLSTMKKGSVLVDVSIDQGGCFETSKATTHRDPVYEVDGIIHYCVANMPGAVARTSTLALTNATLPYVVEIANKGWKEGMRTNKELARGANVVSGHITCEGVAQAFNKQYVPVNDIL